MGEPSDQLDLGAVPRRTCETLVICDECGVEGLRQGDVRRVVGRQVVPQRPDSLEQRVVPIAGDRKAAEQIDRRSAARSRDLVSSYVPPKGLGDLDI
jgi:hypothetical protein